MTRKRLAYFPTPQQELLLKAALLDGPDAVESWKAWKAAIAVEDIDTGSQRLLPCLYRNLAAQGVSDPDMARYKSVYRYVWVENQLRARQAQILLSLLERAGIEVMLLKGLALASIYYDDPGLRPMGDMDFLVRPEQAEAAGRVLADGGWHSPFMAFLDQPGFRNTNHAIFYDKPGNPMQMDLHWHIAHERCWDGADADLWQHAQAFSLRGHPARSLGDTDQLFHTCIHGARQNAVAPIRWVADALTILRRRRIDWLRLLEKLREDGYARRFLVLLSYLELEFAAPVPRDFLEALAAVPVRRVERFEAMLTRWRLPAFLAAAGQFCAFYVRHPHYARGMRGFVRFATARWGTQTIANTMRNGLTRSARHLFG